MEIKKTVKRASAKWPLKIKFVGGLKILLPQQKKFNSFNQKHGCSMAAVATALQLHGIRKTPDYIWSWSKEHISGYTGSKLTLYGCKEAINGIYGEKIATWHAITGTEKNKEQSLKRMRKAIKQNKLILIEQKSPIHTNTIIAKRNGGVWIATNGTVKKTSIKKLYNEALRGKTGKANQDNWYKGGRSSHAAGYVIVK